VPEERDRLCGNWFWDPTLRELAYYQREKKGWKNEPDAVERLQLVASVTWYRWSQAAMESATGGAMGANMSRVVIAYEGGGDLTINETDRSCAEQIARSVASAFGIPVQHEGAPTGRRGGNVPQADSMGRLRAKSGKLEVTLDPMSGEVVVARGRLIGKSRRRLSTHDIRRLELEYGVSGPLETFTVWAIIGPEEERLPVAAYSGYEGWADPQEWRAFTEDLARSLGAEAVIPASFLDTPP
jgi:hypothetical protein